MAWDADTIMGDFLSPAYDMPNRVTAVQGSLIINRLVLIAILLFKATGAHDFFILHGISASRATKKLLPLVGDDEVRANILRQLWRGILVTFVCQGLPKIFPQRDKQLETDEEEEEGQDVETTFPSPTEEERWRRVIDLALGSREEHIIKVVYSLKEEETFFEGQPLEDQELFSREIFLKTGEEMFRNSGQNGEGFTFNGAGFGGVD